MVVEHLLLPGNKVVVSGRVPVVVVSVVVVVTVTVVSASVEVVSDVIEDSPKVLVAAWVVGLLELDDVDEDICPAKLN